MAATAAGITISQSSLLFHPSALSRRSAYLPPALIRTTTHRRGSCLRAVVADAEARPPSLASDPIPVVVEDIKFEEPDIGGGGGGEGSGGDDNSGGGGGDDDSEEEGSGDQDKDKMKGGMSMSQKLTLGYAALVGVGGIMGYLKSGSLKSASAGGLSALVLYYVFTQLPHNPTFASSLGLGISAALLVVMGSRFKKSKKMFPAGIVSVVSFIMAGGYVHGIMRGLH